jgi:VanZ family protein
VLPLRYPSVWLTLGWLLVAGVIVGSLMPGTSLPTFTVSDKVVHAGSYFLLMVWFAGLYRRAFHPLIGVVLLGLGIALDLAQSLTETRSFEPLDLAANFLGILTGLVLSVWWLEGWCERLERRVLALRS